MPNPARFAGFSSPADLLRDTALSREQKLDALRAWRGKVRRALTLNPSQSERLRNLCREIEQAIERAESSDQISRSSGKAISQRTPSGQ